MLEAFGSYFDALSVTEPMRRRLEEVAGFVADLGFSQLDDIFLDQSPTGAAVFGGLEPPVGTAQLVTVAEGGPPQPLAIASVWFFNDDLVTEVGGFMGDTLTFDQTSLRANVTRWECQQTNFSPGTVDPAAWLRVTFSTVLNVSGQMLGTGPNADWLWNLFTSRIAPNLLRP